MMKKIAGVAEDQEENVSANYLVTWLSTVGPVVGLKIPIEYST